MKTIHVFVIISVLSVFACTDKNATNYEKSEIKTLLINDEFGGSENTIEVSYNPKFATVENKLINKSDAAFHEMSQSINHRRLIYTQLDSASKNEYSIEFDYGMSMDPSFTIRNKITSEILAFFPGWKISIPADGTITVSGHTNSMFNQHMLFGFAGDSIFEIQQPFLYVGLKTTTNKAIILYGAQDMKNQIINIKENSEIEVLLNSDELYLIRNSYGITGWWKPADMYQSNEINGLYFAGD